MRYVVDCREQPSENNCTLTIAGEREEVLKAAVEHAISSHGQTDSEEMPRSHRSGRSARLSLSRPPLRHSWVPTRTPDCSTRLAAGG